MTEPSEQQVLDALRTVREPERHEDVVSLGMIAGLAIQDGVVSFSIEVDQSRGAQSEPLRKEAEDAVRSIGGVRSVRAVLTAHRPPAKEARPTASATPAGPAHPQAGQDAKIGLPGVRAIVAVASGKGGVGKSTVAANLAIGLAANGLRVGLLDCDIYGPSMPRMMGISGRPTSVDGKTIAPMENYGVKVMSMGFLVPEDTPMIWRGPMVMSAIEQMLRDVLWGELDIIVVDMPPGTGDAQLTLSQRVALDGAVIVSTPQDIALLDARKGLNMFRKVDVPVLGIIENMSYFLCPHCGERSDIFSHGGARRTAEALGTEFLGEVPLDIAIRETSDAGLPITATQPDSLQAQTYVRIAQRIAVKIDEALGEAALAAPKIVIQ